MDQVMEKMETILFKRLQRYMTSEEINLVKIASQFAKEAHQHHFRDDGITPYFTHPLAVALHIVEQQDADVDCVVAALLHDVVEDIDHVCLPEIEELFGTAVSVLVDGLTKETGVDKASSMALTQEKIIRTTQQDVRVLMIKLADRWHNTSTLEGMNNPKKELEKLNETEEFYLPLGEAYKLFDQVAELKELIVRERQRLSNLLSHLNEAIILEKDVSNTKK